MGSSSPLKLAFTDGFARPKAHFMCKSLVTRMAYAVVAAQQRRVAKTECYFSPRWVHPRPIEAHFRLRVITFLPDGSPKTQSRLTFVSVVQPLVTKPNAIFSPRWVHQAHSRFTFVIFLAVRQTRGKPQETVRSNSFRIRPFYRSLKTGFTGSDHTRPDRF